MQRIDWREVDYSIFGAYEILPRRKGNPGTRKKVLYLRQYATFDIETTRVDIESPADQKRLCTIQPHAVCYVWMMYLPHDDIMITGRTIGEYAEFLVKLKDYLSGTLVIYVHNLSYEFQFLAGVIRFGVDDIFAVKSRKVVKCTAFDRFEFRCSAILSNMSLDMYTRKYNVEHKKLSGEQFDYSIKRYPWTPLTDDEWAYCTNDVVGLAECIEIELQMGAYTIATIPLTSTGFVRMDLKRAMRDISHTLIPSMMPDYTVYELLVDAFRGGDVHANRYYSNQIIDDVTSFDRSSSYPDVLCNCKFPMSKFVKVDDLSDTNLHRLISSGKALLMRVMIKDCQLRNPCWPSPYLSRHKCDILESTDTGAGGVDHALYDNGRVLCAPLVITALTDIDYCIVHEQYEGDYTIIECYAARYGWLPYPYTDCIKAYYDSKTRLKGDPNQQALYEKEKAKINACYGCCAEKPVKMPTYYIDGTWIEGDDPSLPDDLRKDPQELYKDYCKTAWSSYAWGVWCTAWARLRLYEGVKLVARQKANEPGIWEEKCSDFVYCDTDSVKYIGTADWSAINTARLKSSMEQRAYAVDAKGNTHYMGVYEPDGTYSRFITLGAKKYSYVDDDGEIHATISGVNKRLAPAEIARAGGLEALIYNDRQGLFTFRDAGGSELVYNDDDYYTTLDIDGHKLDITKNVAILPSTYTLGMSEDYYLLCNMCSINL